MFFFIDMFEPNHMHCELDRIDTTVGDIDESSIARMVGKSIKIMSKSDNCYLLCRTYMVLQTKQMPPFLDFNAMH